MNSISRPYWNMEIEPKLNTPEMKEIQEHKLKKRIKFLREGAPYYTELFKKYGVDENNIKSFEEFRRAVPIFTKDDWRQLANRYEGNLIEAVNQILPVNAYDDLYLMTSTSGTSGEPEPYPMTKEDLWNYGEMLARFYWRAGIRPNDRVLVAFGLSMFIVGIPSVVGCWTMGALAIPVGAEAGTERILRAARYWRATVLLGTPSLVTYLIEKCPEVLGKSVSELGIRVILCAGEPGVGIPAVRQRIESAYGARLFEWGGSLGISCSHPEYQGMHYVGDDLSIFELVDPGSKEPLPFEDGQRGMTAYTRLEGGGFGWVRHSMGDIMEVYTAPCPCGLSGFRYKVVGRTDDMLKVKGVMVYPIMIKSVLETFMPRITGQFRIVLDQPPPRVEPPLKLKVERGAGFPSDKLEQLAAEISSTMSTKIKVNPTITWVEPGELERSTYKGKTFEKTYEKK